MALFSGFSLLMVDIAVTGQTVGQFTDARDGKTYQTVSYQLKKGKDAVSTITWMAENLNFNSMASHCFANEEANCETKGRLYNWFEATAVCPVSWRLPNDEDWYQLVNLYGGLAKAGKHLKANKRSWPDGKGTNKSGFNGLPTGAFAAKDFHQAKAGFYWSATETEEEGIEASDWSFVPWLDEMRHWSGDKFIGNAVRCIRDSNED